jgi:hypothetical protein
MEQCGYSLDSHLRLSQNPECNKNRERLDPGTTVEKSGEIPAECYSFDVSRCIYLGVCLWGLEPSSRHESL